MEVLKNNENEENDNMEIKVNDSISPCEKFDDMNLKEDLLRGVFGNGFEYPSAIQKVGIPIFIKGHDMIGQAQSGTGKTATFGIGIIQGLTFEEKTTQALVLVPTRELATQHKDVFDALGTYCNISVHACIGGTQIMDDINAFRNGQQIVVGTPGRIYDMINRGLLVLKNLKTLVLDEADQMLDRGFQQQIHEIFTIGIPSDTQIALFSATWTDEAQIIAQKFMRNPKIIEVKKENTTLEGIKQYKIDVGRDENKFETLVDLYKAISIKQAIIYCNTKKRVDEISYKLKEREMSVSSMHSEMNQNDRNKIMKNFRAGASRILLSTDLNARGIDIQQVSLVINYDIPNNKENYIHRIGRSGRFGRKGIALNFVSDKEKAALDEIETYYKTVVEDLPSNIEQVMSY